MFNPATTQIEDTNDDMLTGQSSVTELNAGSLVETMLNQWASGDAKKVDLLKYIIGASITDKA